MYALPQEIEVWYIIPTIRRELAKLLTKKHKLKLKEVGEILGVSEAAISQYLNKKRATKLKLPKNIKKEIEKSAVLLAKDKKLALREILRLLALVKRTKSSCLVCQKYNKGILSVCKMKPLATGELAK